MAELLARHWRLLPRCGFLPPLSRLLSCGSLSRTESLVRRFVLFAGVVIYILQHSPSTGRWIREIASRLSTIIASRGGLPTWQPTNSSFPDRRDLIRSRWTLAPALLDLESGQFDAGWTLCTRCTARSPRKPQTRDLHTRAHTPPSRIRSSSSQPPFGPKRPSPSQGRSPAESWRRRRRVVFFLFHHTRYTDQSSPLLRYCLSILPVPLRLVSSPSLPPDVVEQSRHYFCCTTAILVVQTIGSVPQIPWAAEDILALRP